MKKSAAKYPSLFAALEPAGVGTGSTVSVPGFTLPASHQETGLP